MKTLIYCIILIMCVALLSSCSSTIGVKSAATCGVDIVCPKAVEYPVPNKPEMQVVTWTKGYTTVNTVDTPQYCLDESNAKKLLINHVVNNDYINRLLLIIESYKKAVQTYTEQYGTVPKQVDGTVPTKDSK